MMSFHRKSEKIKALEKRVAELEKKLSDRDVEPKIKKEHPLFILDNVQMYKTASLFNLSLGDNFCSVRVFLPTFEEWSELGYKVSNTKEEEKATPPSAAYVRISFSPVSQLEADEISENLKNSLNVADSIFASVLIPFYYDKNAQTGYFNYVERDSLLVSLGLFKDNCPKNSHIIPLIDNLLLDPLMKKLHEILYSFRPPK